MNAAHNSALSGSAWLRQHEVGLRVLSHHKAQFSYRSSAHALLPALFLPPFPVSCSRTLPSVSIYAQRLASWRRERASSPCAARRHDEPSRASRSEQFCSASPPSRQSAAASALNLELRTRVAAERSRAVLYASRQRGSQARPYEARLVHRQHTLNITAPSLVLASH